MSNASLRNNLFTFLSKYDVLTSGHLLITDNRIVVSEKPVELLPDETGHVRFHLQPPSPLTYDAVRFYILYIEDHILYDCNEF
jgi:hypothetical protein